MADYPEPSLASMSTRRQTDSNMASQAIKSTLRHDQWKYELNKRLSRTPVKHAEYIISKGPRVFKLGSTVRTYESQPDYSTVIQTPVVKQDSMRSLLQSVGMPEPEIPAKRYSYQKPKSQIDLVVEQYEKECKQKALQI